jgi:hypothetical protein
MRKRRQEGEWKVKALELNAKCLDERERERESQDNKKLIVTRWESWKNLCGGLPGILVYKIRALFSVLSKQIETNLVEREIKVVNERTREREKAQSRVGF